MLDWNTWNYLTLYKLFVLRIITYSSKYLEMIIMNYK